MSQLGWESSPAPCLGLCLGAAPPPHPVPALRRWPLSQAHLPVCQQGALNSRELLGRMCRSETSSSKRSPRWCASVLEVGNPARRARSAGKLWPSPLVSSPSGNHRKFPREQEQVLQTPSLDFGRLRTHRGLQQSVAGANFSLLKMCIISCLNLLCFNFR